MYNTKQKNAILNVFKENSNKSFNAKEIISILNKNSSKATIYRQLDQFCNQKILNKYYNESACCYEFSLNDKNHDCNNHLHLKCNKCGNIIHLKNHLINDSDIKIDYEHSLLYGTCNNCLK